MSSLAGILALRLIHIVSGVFWVGGAILLAWFIVPAVRDAGSAGGPVMSQLVQVRRMPIYLMAAAILTVLSGIALFWRDSGGFQGIWMRSGTGAMFGLGGLLGLVSAAIGSGVTAPIGRRLGVIAAGAQARGGPSAEEAAEMQRLQARLAGVSSLVAVLLLLATAAMATARYVR